MPLNYQPEYAPVPKDFRPELGLSRMTTVIDRNEKAYWLLQVPLTPYNASKAGLKYEPHTWSGIPMIRVIWVNRDGHLAEFQEWLSDGQPVQVPGLWKLSVEEAIWTADTYSNVGYAQTVQWMQEAQETSTMIDDAIDRAFQISEMAQNRSQFGPAVTTQRNGFPQELRRVKFNESAEVWK